MKRILLIIAFISSVYTVSAQDLQDVFLSMPSHIVLGLEAAQKDKLIANTQDTAQITVERETIGSLKRVAISPDYICLQTSDAGTTQIKLLPLINESKIICVVKTVCGGKVCDSQIQFYTTKWTPISQDLFPNIDKDWFIKADADKGSQEFKNAYASLDMSPMRISLSPKSTNIEVFYDIKDYLSEEDYKNIQPFLIEGAKVLEWDKASYK